MKHLITSMTRIVALFAVVAVPSVVVAASTIDTVIFGEDVERIIEVVNLVFALFAGVFAVKLAALSQGGTMEKTWNTLAIVAIIFVVLEIVGTLKGFELVHIAGLAEIIEFLFVVVFAYCLYFTRKDLLKKTLG